MKLDRPTRHKSPPSSLKRAALPGVLLALFVLFTGLWFLRSGACGGEGIEITRDASVRVVTPEGIPSVASGSEEERASIAPAEPSGEPEDSELLEFAQEQSPALAMLEPWQELRWNELERTWAKILDEHSRQSVSMHQVSALVQVGLRPILDEMGLGQEVPQGERQLHLDPNEHYMNVGNREFRIPHGVHPVLDDFMDRWAEYRRLEEERHDRIKDRSRRTFPPPPVTPFPMDVTFLEDLERLLKQAKAAIARRKDVY